MVVLDANVISNFHIKTFATLNIKMKQILIPTFSSFSFCCFETMSNVLAVEFQEESLLSWIIRRRKSLSSVCFLSISLRTLSCQSKQHLHNQHNHSVQWVEFVGGNEVYGDRLARVKRAQTICYSLSLELVIKSLKRWQLVKEELATLTGLRGSGKKNPIKGEQLQGLQKKVRINKREKGQQRSIDKKVFWFLLRWKLLNKRMTFQFILSLDKGK